MLSPAKGGEREREDNFGVHVGDLAARFRPARGTTKTRTWIPCEVTCCSKSSVCKDSTLRQAPDILNPSSLLADGSGGGGTHTTFTFESRVARG
jgi:hypothetical protein